MKAITQEMIRAGEEVLDRACENADLPCSSLVISAARDVYIAMSLAAQVERKLARTTNGL